MKFYSIFVALFILLSPGVYIINFVLIGDAVAQASEITEQQVAELYVATFNRAPNKPGLDFWVNDSGFTIEQIAESFFDQTETQALYPLGTTDTLFVTSVYNNLFNRAPNAAGLDYWADALGSGVVTRPVMIEAVKNGAQGTDAEIVSNKAEAGLYFASLGLEGGGFSLADVTDDITTVETSKNAMDDSLKKDVVDTKKKYVKSTEIQINKVFNVNKIIYFEYDHYGNVLKESYDEGRDGTIDSFIVTDNNFDSSGKLISSVTNHDNEYGIYSEKTNYTYYDSGKIKSTKTSSMTITFDGNGNMLTRLNHDAEFGGLSTWTYNEHNDELSYICEIQNKIVETMTFEYKYNGDGLKISKTTTYNNFWEDDIPASFERIDYFYDDKGNLIREEKSNIDDWYIALYSDEVESFILYSYDDYGNRISKEYYTRWVNGAFITPIIGESELSFYYTWIKI